MQLTSPVEALTTVNAEHPTAGLPGYPAHDWFAPAGTAVVSPAAGVVTKLSGHDPAVGLIDGPHGPFGWSVYVNSPDGHTYYLTHMQSRAVSLGQVVKRGQLLGRVAAWPAQVTPSHIHMGVHAR